MAISRTDKLLSLYELAATQAGHFTTAQAAAGARIHTTAVPLRADEIATRFGVRITSPARTIADVAEAGGDPSVVMDATARAMATGLVSAAELSAAAKDRPARVQELLRRAIRDASAGQEGSGDARTH